MSLSDVDRSICHHLTLRAGEMYERLEAAVAIPTGKDHGPGLDAYRNMLAARLRALGATVELRPGVERPAWMRQPGARDERSVVHPTLVARREGNPSHQRILVAGHIDTVHDPAGDFQHLTRQSDGAHAVGPGAVDMKGGIELAVSALEALHALHPSIGWTVLLNSDEETGSFQSDHVLREEARRHDVGLALEPALPGGALAVERMGSGQFRVDVFGRAAHVGREFTRGVSAVSRLGEVLVALGALAKPDDGMIVNVGPLQGGSATNIVPDHASCWGNVRFDDPAAGARLAEAIDGLATSDDALPRVLVHRAWNRPAKPLTPAVERLAFAARAAAEDLNQSLPFARTGGVCDGNILQEAGLPTLDTLGIRGGNLHRTDEFIEIVSLVERAQLFAVLMRRLTDEERIPHRRNAD